MEHFSIKGMYWGVIFGAILFGLGWALSGFCPGTGMAGMGAGRLDAFFYFVGGLTGAYVFAIFYSDLTSTFLYLSFSSILHYKLIPKNLIKIHKIKFTNAAS